MSGNLDPRIDFPGSQELEDTTKSGRKAGRPSGAVLAVAGGVLATAAALTVPFAFSSGEKTPGVAASPSTETPTPSPTTPAERYCASEPGVHDFQDFKAGPGGTFRVKVLAACALGYKTILRSTPNSTSMPAPGAGEPLANGTEVEVQCRAEGDVMINDAGVENTMSLSVQPVTGNTHRAGFLNLIQLGRASGLPEHILHQIPECQDPFGDLGAVPSHTPTASETPPIVRD